MSTKDRSIIGDPVRLRALAHPTRLDILERLVTDGPLTATEAGERIGQSSGSTSFHLRQLERYGFVEPVPDVAGRQKPWRLAMRGLSWFREDGTLAADTEAEAGELARTGAAVSTMLLQRAVDDAGAWLEAAADERGAWAGNGEVTSRVRYVCDPNSWRASWPRWARCSSATTTSPMPTIRRPEGSASPSSACRSRSHEADVRRLMADRDLRRLFVGQTASLLGDSMMLLALAVWVKDLTGSNGAAGGVILLIVAPSLGAPLAGYVVDRVRRRRFLVVANLLSALAVLPLLAVGDDGPTWLVLVVAVLYGVSFAFIGPGMSALLQAVVPTDELAHANGLIQTVKQGLRLVGPLMGAGLYAAIGGGAVAIVDAATFLVAAACLWSMRTTDPVPEAMPSRLRVEMAAGMRHIRATPVLSRTVLATAVAVLVVGFDEAVIFAVVEDGLHRDPAFIGVLSSGQGVGAVLGGLIVARLIGRYGEPRVLGVGLLALAAGCALMGTGALAPVMVGALVFGMGLTWVIVAFNTLIQTRTPGHLVGRTASAVGVAIGAPQTLSIGLGALAVSQIDYRLLLLAMVVVLTGCGAALLRPHPDDVIGQSLAAGERGEALDRRCRRGRLDRLGEGVAVAQRRQRLLGERLDLGDERIGRRRRPVPSQWPGPSRGRGRRGPRSGRRSSPGTSPNGAWTVRSSAPGLVDGLGQAGERRTEAGRARRSVSGSPGSSPRNAAANIVAPPIMCSSTPRTVNSAHGVGLSSWSGEIAADDAREQRAELRRAGSSDVHRSSWSASDLPGRGSALASSAASRSRPSSMSSSPGARWRWTRVGHTASS